MPTAYGWLDAGKFHLSLFPAGHSPRSRNTYDTPEALKAAADQAGLTLQWDDPQAVAVWVKARSEPPPMPPMPQPAVTPAPTVEILPPVPPPAPPIAPGTSLAPPKSTAATTLATIQSLKAVIAEMNAANADSVAAVTKLQVKIAAQKAVNKAIHDLADGMDV
jgi:hypothetical protein